MVLGHVALGKHDVVVPHPSDPDFRLVEAKLPRVSAFLGQRQDQHGITLSKNAPLVHLGRRGIGNYHVGPVCGGMEGSS